MVARWNTHREFGVSIRERRAVVSQKFPGPGPYSGAPLQMLGLQRSWQACVCVTFDFCWTVSTAGLVIDWVLGSGF